MTGALSQNKRRLLDRYVQGEPARPRIDPRPPGSAAPLSGEQELIWLHSQLAPELPLYNEILTLRRTGALDVPALARSLEEVVRRHQAWRTSFETAGGTARQVVHPPPMFSLPITDLASLAPAEREQEARRIATEAARRPFDLVRGPLLRVKLVRMAESEYRLYVVLHQIIHDGVSVYSVFAPELIAIYQAFVAGTEGKVDVWQRTLADDAFIIDEFGRKQDKAAVLKDIRPLPAGFSGSIQIRSPQVRVYGDTAVIDFESFEQETVFDQKLVVRYIFSATFVRQEGSWKMVMLSGATLPTPPPALTVKDLRLEDYPGTYRYGPERAWIVGVSDGKLSFRTRADRPATTLEPIAKDVFMDAGEEKNLIIFRRGSGGRVEELIERRKFNDLRMKRENDAGGGRRSVRTRN